MLLATCLPPEIRFYVMPSFTTKMFSFIPFSAILIPWVGLQLRRETACNSRFGITVNGGLSMSLGLDDITVGLLDVFSDKTKKGSAASTGPGWKFAETIDLSFQIPGIAFKFAIIPKMKIVGPFCLAAGALPKNPNMGSELAASGDYSKARVAQHSVA